MAEEKLERAKKAYETLCATLDSKNWHYTKDEEKLSIDCGAQGEDLPMEIKMVVDAERQIVLLLSHMPFVIAEDKRLDVAIATSIVNNNLVDGSFDFDIPSGHMFFRMTSSFIDCEIGGELLMFMLMISFHTIDKYNDKFLLLAKGMIGIKDFMINE